MSFREIGRDNKILVYLVESRSIFCSISITVNIGDQLSPKTHIKIRHCCLLLLYLYVRLALYLCRHPTPHHVHFIFISPNQRQLTLTFIWKRKCPWILFYPFPLQSNPWLCKMLITMISGWWWCIDGTHLEVFCSIQVI